MNVRQRIFLSYSPVPLMLLGLLVLTLWLWGASASQASRVQERIQQGIAEGQRLMLGVTVINLDEFDFTRRYPLMGHTPAEAMRRVDVEAAQVRRSFDALHHLLPPGPDRAALEAAESHFDAFMKVDMRLRDLVRQGRVEEADELNVVGSLKIYDDLRTAVQRLLAQEQATFEQVHQQQTELRHRAFIAVLTGGLLLVGASLLIGGQLARGLSSPITDLESEAREIQAGHAPRPQPSARVAAVTELASLHRAMVEMAGSLADMRMRLEDANAHLEDEVSSRTVELHAALKRLEQNVLQLRSLDQLKNSFVSTVSHELRTPLTSIMGYAEFLEDELGGSLSPMQQEFVEQIRMGAQRLARLVDDLLDFARLEGGTFALQREPMNLTALVRNVISSMAPQAAAAGLRLRLGECPEVRLYADAGRLAQVVLNFLQNAIKFTPRGGTIAVELAQEDDHVRVSVRDTGRGIPLMAQPHVFEKFFQVDPSNTREQGGAGLGLAISKALIEAHGGTIGMQSAPDVGSTFWFLLPLEARIAAPALPD